MNRTGLRLVRGVWLWLPWGVVTMNARVVLCSSAVVALLGCGCSTVPETGRSQMNLYSSEEESQMGLTEFNSMKKEVPFSISKDSAANAMVQRVGQRIAAVAQLPGAQWEFGAFESKEANAFCLPGGKVGIYTGILPICKDDAGLAAVMGHEVAHGGPPWWGTDDPGPGAQHGRSGGGRPVGIVQILPVGTAGDAGLRRGCATRSRLTAQSGTGVQADEIGILYMARAGYDPRAAVAFWQRFAAYNQSGGGSSTAWFMSTHPTDEGRIESLQKLLPKAEAEYQSAKSKAPAASGR